MVLVCCCYAELWWWKSMKWFLKDIVLLLVYYGLIPWDVDSKHDQFKLGKESAIKSSKLKKQTYCTTRFLTFRCTVVWAASLIMPVSASVFDIFNDKPVHTSKWHPNISTDKLDNRSDNPSPEIPRLAEMRCVEFCKSSRSRRLVPSDHPWRFLCRFFAKRSKKLSCRKKNRSCKNMTWETRQSHLTIGELPRIGRLGASSLQWSLPADQSCDKRRK
jgi:hypothetical protein